METKLTSDYVKSSIISIALFLSLSGTSFQAGASESSSEVAFQRFFTALNFEQPTALIQQPEDNHRFYVLEKAGRIYYFANQQDTDQKIIYLDISDDRVDSSWEGGLLGIAFDPDFAANRYVYLSYTSSEAPLKDDSPALYSRISRFQANPDNTAVLPDSEDILITIDQPWNNHNGGQIAFGPDGFLYAGFGDGGSWGDPNRNAQNTHTMLGTMLRIDVRLTAREIKQGLKYKIPRDNPFADSDNCGNGKGCPEIFAWGFRNPWRWSFDRKTGGLWVGDVGQGDWEEIDLVEQGGNYGWNCFEGLVDYRLKLCDKQTSYVKPITTYSHLPSDTSRDGKAASVTGGYVYRGERIPELRGHYIFGDFVHGILWRLPNPYSRKPVPIKAADTDFFIVSFAEDNEGEIYFLDFNSGAIYGLVDTNNRQ